MASCFTNATEDQLASGNRRYYAYARTAEVYAACNGGWLIRPAHPDHMLLLRECGWPPSDCSCMGYPLC